MCEAIVRGCVSSNSIRASEICVVDRNAPRRAIFADLGMQVLASVNDLPQARIVLVAVRPDQVLPLLSQVSSQLVGDPLIVSVAAAVSISSMARALDPQRRDQETSPEPVDKDEKPFSRWRIIRVMPNTPASLGCGMAGYALSPSVTRHDVEQLKRVLESSSRLVEVKESQINIVAGLSGSGPAYFLYMVDNLIHTATEMGIAAPVARILLAQTLLGTAKMLELDPHTPSEMVSSIATPGGTTRAALNVLAECNLGLILDTAVKKNMARAEEIAQGLLETEQSEKI